MAEIKVKVDARTARQHEQTALYALYLEASARLKEVGELCDSTEAAHEAATQAHSVEYSHAAALWTALNRLGFEPEENVIGAPMRAPDWLKPKSSSAEGGER